MRQCKPFTLPAIKLAALIVLLATSGGVALRAIAGAGSQTDSRGQSRQLRHPLPTKTSAIFGHRSTSRIAGSGPLMSRADWGWPDWRSRPGVGIVGIANRTANFCMN